MRTTETELAVLCDISVVLPRNYLNIKSQNPHVCWRWHHVTSSRWVALRFFQQKAKVDGGGVEHEGRFRAPPSLPAPHFPNCCYSCFWPDISQWSPRCGGGRLGFHSLSERPDGGQLPLFCRFVPPLARRMRPPRSRSNTSNTGSSPWKDHQSAPTRSGDVGTFFLGPQHVKEGS